MSPRPRRLRSGIARAAGLVAIFLAGLPALAAAQGPAVAAPAAGRIVATIPLPRVVSQAVVAGGNVWVLTSFGSGGKTGPPSTHLVRVSAGSNRVVGTPIDFPGDNDPYTLKIAGNRLWAFGAEAVYRIDPRSGGITGTISLPGPGGVSGLDVAGDTLLLLRGGSTPRLLRYDARTLRACTSGCSQPPVGRLPADGAFMQVQGPAVFVSTFGFSGPSTLIRLATRAAPARSVVLTGDALVAGPVAWVAAGEGIARLDLATFAYDPVVVRTPGRTITHLTRGLGAIWAAGSAFIERRNAPPILRRAALFRVDPATGALAGAPVALPESPFAIATGLGAVWVTTSDALLRVRPTRPRPAPAPLPAPSSPAPLLTGPLAAGTYLSQSPFELPLALTLADGGWISTPSFGSSGSLAREVLQLQRADSVNGQLYITLPTGIYGASGKVVAASPAEAIAAWQTNPKLTITTVGTTTVGGRPATVIDLEVKGKKTFEKIIAVTGDFISQGDDGSGARAALRIVLTQSSTGRLVVALISLGAKDALGPAQAVVEGLAFP